MSKTGIVIREIKSEDDAQVAEVIRSVLVEMGAPKVGTAYADSSLDAMTASYDREDAMYFVVEEGTEIIGGAGIAPLKGTSEPICELQKMYFLTKARGRGLGKEMMAVCLEKAKSLGYNKCYLETLPYMSSAAKLYRASGFENLEGPLGQTGHYSCNVWMIKPL